MNNIYSEIPEQLPEELFQQFAGNGQVRIERIVSRGHASPEEGWYDQPQEEWVIVLRGSAILAYPDKPSVTLKEGDYVTIAAHEKHRVAWTSPDEPTIWLAVHY